MDQDVETQFHTIDLFVRSILDDISKVSSSTTKADMMAYMDAWKTELGTIQHIINIDGII
jgi:hypothetical protein